MSVHDLFEISDGTASDRKLCSLLQNYLVESISNLEMAESALQKISGPASLEEINQLTAEISELKAQLKRMFRSRVPAIDDLKRVQERIHKLLAEFSAVTKASRHFAQT